MKADAGRSQHVKIYYFFHVGQTQPSALLPSLSLKLWEGREKERDCLLSKCLREGEEGRETVCLCEKNEERERDCVCEREGGRERVCL